MAAHRYWRVQLTLNYFGAPDTTFCGECQMATAPGGANVAVGGVASASSFQGALVPARAFDGDQNTQWGSLSEGGGNRPWLQYDFGGSPQDIAEIRWSNYQNGGQSFMPASGDIFYSDDNVNFTHFAGFTAGPWPNGVNTFETLSLVIGATPEVRAPQGGSLAVHRVAAQEIRLPQGNSLAVYNVPAKNMFATFADEHIVYSRISQGIEITQANALAVYRGKIANPRVRAWTFTLDGHDFYVLRLGDTATLLYDLASEQWIDWTSDVDPFWRANTGMTWTDGQALGPVYGSNVLVGDDTFGLLWLLDPRQAFDDHPLADNINQQIPFPRIVTGQVLARGRQFLPCYAIFLDGDNFGLSGVEFAPGVTLETSDDQGRTFDDQGTISVPADYTDNNPYTWTSLGQISSPGRIFRVTDNGVFARIDSMEMNDDA